MRWKTLGSPVFEAAFNLALVLPTGAAAARSTPLAPEAQNRFIAETPVRVDCVGEWREDWGRCSVEKVYQVQGQVDFGCLACQKTFIAASCRKTSEGGAGFCCKILSQKQGSVAEECVFIDGKRF